MKKMLFVLVALLIASPAMADVDITASADVNDDTAVITISYEATAGELIRAIALDITLDGDATITDVNCVNGQFAIYPGSISIAGDGTVSDVGSCECDDSYAGTLGGTGTTGATVEMGSLYVGAGNAPAADGDVVEITIQGNDDVNVCVVLNAIRGGVVLEDPDEAVTVNVECVTVPLAPGTCMAPSHPDYAMWVTRGMPDCWCYHKQCNGDIDGLSQGPFAVSLNDLIIMRTAINQLVIPAGGECADLDHASQGPFAVSLNDLIILRTTVNQLVVSDCDGTHISFWTN